MISAIQDYQRNSGLTINMSKICSHEHRRQIAGLKVVERFQTLGVWFSRDDDPEFDYDLNFQPILWKMKRCCSSWELRSLSLKGKIVVINTLVVSLLQYMCSLIYTPQKVLDEVKALTVEFTWAGGRSKVAYSTLIQTASAGGLN